MLVQIWEPGVVCEDAWACCHLDRAWSGHLHQCHHPALSLLLSPPFGGTKRLSGCVENPEAVLGWGMALPLDLAC